MTAREAGLTRAAAENLAGWHEASVAALAFGSRRWPDAWATSEPVPPMYFRWIATAPETADGAVEQPAADRIEQLFRGTSGPLGVCDPWSRLDLRRLGFVRTSDAQAWMVRPPAPLASVEPPPHLEVVEVRDADALAAFEAASSEGFGAPPVPRFSLHGPPLLDEPRSRIWVGLVGGAAVSGAMAFLHAGVVGVYGVSTVPAARGRGYATALTLRAAAADPRLPSVLQPSAMAEPLYRRLGYERFAAASSWFRG